MLKGGSFSYRLFSFLWPRFGGVADAAIMHLLGDRRALSGGLNVKPLPAEAVGVGAVVIGLCLPSGNAGDA